MFIFSSFTFRMIVSKSVLIVCVFVGSWVRGEDSPGVERPIHYSNLFSGPFIGFTTGPFGGGDSRVLARREIIKATAEALKAVNWGKKTRAVIAISAVRDPEGVHKAWVFSEVGATNSASLDPRRADIPRLMNEHNFRVSANAYRGIARKLSENADFAAAINRHFQALGNRRSSIEDPVLSIEISLPIGRNGRIDAARLNESGVLPVTREPFHTQYYDQNVGGIVKDLRITKRWNVSTSIMEKPSCFSVLSEN